MSDLMLLGILRMPLSMVEGDPLNLVQLVQCANGAADRIEYDARLIDQLRAELEAREADRRDAERYRFLRKRVIYEGSSDWTIEVSGRFASFEEALEYQMSLARRQEGEDDERA